MLSAFHEKLKKLADDPGDAFRAAVIARVGPRDAVRYEGPVRNMILAVPEMLTQISVWSRDLGLPEPLRRAQMFALAYLYNPDDFLPESTHGLFGYVDDAYIAAAVYNRTLQEVGPAGLRPLVDNTALSLRVPAWVELTRALLPDETDRIERLLDEHRTPRENTRSHRGPLPVAAPGDRTSARAGARTPKHTRRRS